MCDVGLAGDGHVVYGSLPDRAEAATAVAATAVAATLNYLVADLEIRPFNQQHGHQRCLGFLARLFRH